MNTRDHYWTRVAKAAARLRHLFADSKGNVLMIMALALIPVAAMVGSGLDMGRDYLVKSRLQSACDAGALAARKAASVSTSGVVTIDSSSTGIGNNFFRNNFPAGMYGATYPSANASTPLTLAVDANAASPTYNQVSGTASAIIPVTLTSVIGGSALTITVHCKSKLELANTDIMFVLDNTGSMNDCPDNTSCGGNSSSKIAGLKTAVMNFYNTLQTDVSTGTQVRYGFVPYTSTVNVGNIVYGANSNYITNSFTYQSAVANMTTPVYTPTVGSAVAGSNSTQTQYAQNCINGYSNSSGSSPSPTTVTTYSFFSWQVGGTTYTSTGAIPSKYKSGGSSQYTYSSNNCVYKTSSVTTTYPITAYSFTSWSYQPTSYDTSNFKTGATVPVSDGTTPPSSVTITPAQYAAKTQYNLAELAALSGYPSNQTRTLKWDGCIQEADTIANHAYTYTTATSSYSPANPNDMQVDLVPTSGNTAAAQATQWRPTWDSVVWDSNMFGSGPDQPFNYGIQNVGGTYQYSGYYACPAAAANLQVWANSSAVQNYVNTMSANGGTYHDIGMIWGGRLISPTGLFSATNSAIAPNGQPITSRHIVFMTDGLMCANRVIDSGWGYETLDKRILGSTPNSGTADCTTPGATSDELNQRHVSRLLAICNAIKGKNITIWTIDFGAGSGGQVDPNLQQCSTNNGTTSDVSHSFYAADTNALNNIFAQIAKSVAKLKLTS